MPVGPLGLARSVRALTVAALAALLLATGCGSAPSPADAPGAPASPAARRLIDDTGAAVDVPSPPRRIAALAPDLAEIVHAVGAGESLVGACDPCDRPEAVARLPRLGPMTEPSIEAILLIRPDLVLATGEGNPLAAVTRMRSLGLPVFGLDPGPGLAGIARHVRRIGDLVGRSENAESLAADMERRIRAVREASSRSRRLRSCILVWTDPLVAAGTDSYLTELADAAGAGNACATGPGWPVISREVVLAAQPEVILLGIADGEARLGDWAASVPAVAADAVLQLPESPFLRPSADLGRAAEELLVLLAPAREAAAGAGP